MPPSTNVATTPIASLSRTSDLDIASATEPTCIYDVPAYVSAGIINASDAVNFWTTEHSTDVVAADREFQQRGPLTDNVQMQIDLHLYRPEHDLAHARTTSPPTRLSSRCCATPSVRYTTWPPASAATISPNS